MEHALSIRSLLGLNRGTGIIPSQKPVGNTLKRNVSPRDFDCEIGSWESRCRCTDDQCDCDCDCDCSDGGE
jgi:hypothetical protein